MWDEAKKRMAGLCDKILRLFDEIENVTQHRGAHKMEMILAVKTFEWTTIGS
jgi:hypothetical protein